MIVVTGAAGFIGSNLIKKLSQLGLQNLVICDTLQHPTKWKNLAGLAFHDLIHPDDLLSFLEENQKKIQVIFHLGALLDDSDNNVDALIKTNFKLGMDLLMWCGRARVRFIYASTAATYGGHQQDATDGYDVAALSKLQQQTAYGWSKHLFDQALAITRNSCDRSYPLPPQYVGLKFFHVYGPHENHKDLKNRSLVAQFYHQAKTSEAILISQSKNSDGGQWQDFVHVDDCVNILAWFYERSDVNGLFNVGTGQSRSLSDLATLIFRTLQHPPLIEMKPLIRGQKLQFPYSSQANINSLRQAGYTAPFISLEDGVKSYINYLEETEKNF